MVCRQRSRLNNFHSISDILLRLSYCLETFQGSVGGEVGAYLCMSGLLLLGPVPKHLCEEDIRTLLDAGTRLEYPRAGGRPVILDNIRESLSPTRLMFAPLQLEIRTYYLQLMDPSTGVYSLLTPSMPAVVSML